MVTEADLLAGIALHPDELDRWLILSDWLEDEGDPRAELARLRYLLHVEADHPERAGRLARQQALLDSGLSPVVPIRNDNTLRMPLALMLPGTFPMGSPETEEERYDDETLHPVRLTEAYYLGVYPVTVGEYATFVKATGYRTEAETSGGAWGYDGRQWKKDASFTWRSPGSAQTERHPVVCVSWNDAQALVGWLNEDVATGLVYSLPTEAEWEYGCRAGTQTAYFWGDDPTRLGEHAWFEENAGGTTHPVETKRPNPWGLRQVHGNIWEWCEDLHGAYLTEAVVNPRGSLSGGSSRVVRGGSWDLDARGCRSATRGGNDPANRITDHGFRLAVSIRAR